MELPYVTASPSLFIVKDKFCLLIIKLRENIIRFRKLLYFEESIYPKKSDHAKKKLMLFQARLVEFTKVLGKKSC